MMRLSSSVRWSQLSLSLCVVSLLTIPRQYLSGPRGGLYLPAISFFSFSLSKQLYLSPESPKRKNSR